MKKIYILIILLYQVSTYNAYSQCHSGSSGSACGSGATGSVTASLDPANTNETWDSKTWYRWPVPPASLTGSNVTSNNNYFEFNCARAGTIFEIAMDGYTDDEVTVTDAAGNNRLESDRDNCSNGSPNSGDGDRFYYQCPTTGTYRIRFSRQGGCCTYSSCQSYSGWAWIRIRIAFQPCAGSPAYGSGVWNGYVYDGTVPDYFYGSIGTQSWNNISQDWGNGQPISSGCGQMCDADN